MPSAWWTTWRTRCPPRPWSWWPEAGPCPRRLSKAVGASGEVVDTSVGTGRARSQWLADHLQGGPVRLDGPATARALRASG